MGDGIGLNAASRAFGIPKPTIRRHRPGLNKYASEDVKCMGGPLSLPAAVEDELVKHVKDLDDMMFGMTANDLMGLAYEVAVAHGIKKFSDVKKSAGKKWSYNFMRRHPDLSLRSPEPTSLARAAGFNREAVYNFFDLLEKPIDEHNFTPAKIYNVDETGHSTVQTPSKVLSTKGKRQVGVTTSAERGSTITGVYCDSGTGNYLAPMIVFRRKRICNSLKTDAPVGTIFACTDSGWIDSDCFVMWLKHFIKSANSSMDNKHLLLMDGHASHTKNLEAIRLARDNGVTMLSFPPHTTHKMQPLDVSFFRSLKNWYNIEIKKFLRTHPGQAITVHQVSKLVNASFLAASTMSTAVNGFRKAGIWPCNRHVFDGEFDRIESLQGSCDGSPSSTVPGACDGGLPRPVPGAGDGGLPRPVTGAGDGSLPSPVPGAGDGSLPSPVPGAGDGSLPSSVPGAGDGSLPSPVPGAGDGSLPSSVPGAGDGSLPSPVPGAGDGSLPSPVPGAGDSSLHSPVRGQVMAVSPVPCQGQVMAVSLVPCRGQVMAVSLAPCRGQVMVVSLVSYWGQLMVVSLVPCRGQVMVVSLVPCRGQVMAVSLVPCRGQVMSVPLIQYRCQLTYRGQCSRSIPSKGDGRCFFRSVAISLDASLQSAERDQKTGEIVDKLASLSETAQVVKLRSRAVTHMCQTGNVAQDEAPLSADMPPNLKFKTLIDRIEHMSNPLSMIGEQEVKATAEVVGRNIHVIIEGHSSRSNVMYRGCDGDDLPPILVKYTPNGDAGHYEAIISLRVNDISPLPQKVRKKKSIRASKAEVLTSSPYKKHLEIKSSQSKIINGSRKSKTPSNDERLGKKRKNVKPGMSETKGRGQNKSKKFKTKHDDDVNCIVCGELFSESRPGETWVMCVMCSNWAHLQCTPNDNQTYVCDDCAPESYR